MAKLVAFLCVLGVILLVSLLIGWLEHRHNKKMFNNGVCIKCGHDLMLIDKNENGRLYECPNCKRKIYRLF